VVGLSVLLAVPAWADPEGDFLNQLGNIPGVTINGFTSGLLLNAGNQACGHLRDGLNFDDTVGAMMWYPGASTGTMRALVSTAQHTMCPDTLR
jgi:hypothetical protein